MTFLVLALPRSRTAWMAHYLCYGPRLVGHDIAIECRKLEDFTNSYTRGMWGTVETGVAMAWRLVRKEMPELKMVTIRREPADVRKSLEAFGIEVPEGEMEHRAALLELIGRQEGVESIDFSDLDDPMCCRWLFEYCLELPWDARWWEAVRNLNIQVDMWARLQQLAVGRERIERLKLEVERRIGELPPLQMDS